jgi:uncharacterized protein (TIGR02246 family)
MRIKRGIIVAAVVAVLCGGYIAQGQIREKAAEAVKKGGEAGKTAVQTVQKPADTGKKSADTAKKPADTTKTAAAKSAEDPEEKIIRAGAEAFTKLYNAHDAKGLAALFTPKAEMIDEDGQVTKGREAIESEFAKVFKETPKATMTVDVESVRVLTSMLAIEEGTARSKDSPNDSEDVTVYVAIHVKTDGKWQLACVRDWDAPPEELSPHDQLEQNLAWLVGEWIDESPDSVVHTVCKWHDNGNFLMQEFQVNVGGDIAMSGTLRIGWDAVAKQFKSWVFDSHGGHSTGAWLQDGDRWIIKMQGATAKGEVGSSTIYYRPIDKDTIAWGSFDRVIDGERLEDIPEIIVKRRPLLPTE